MIFDFRKYSSLKYRALIYFLLIVRDINSVVMLMHKKKSLNPKKHDNRF